VGYAIAVASASCEQELAGGVDAARAAALAAQAPQAAQADQAPGVR
jgi:hypothetical protein